MKALILSFIKKMAKITRHFPGLHLQRFSQLFSCLEYQSSSTLEMELSLSSGEGQQPSRMVKMRTEDIFALGLGLTPPWQVLSQRLDTEKTPHELHLDLGADRGATYPCPTCGRNCKAHDFEEFTWRHLNFFQHHCYLTARVPRVTCPKHVIRRIIIP